MLVSGSVETSQWWLYFCCISLFLKYTRYSNYIGQSFHGSFLDMIFVGCHLGKFWSQLVITCSSQLCYPCGSGGNNIHDGIEVLRNGERKYTNPCKSHEMMKLPIPTTGTRINILETGIHHDLVYSGTVPSFWWNRIGAVPQDKACCWCCCPPDYLPSLKLTASLHLKMDGWNTSFLLGWPIFRGYVSFRECMFEGEIKQTIKPKDLHIRRCKNISQYGFGDFWSLRDFLFFSNNSSYNSKL